MVKITKLARLIEQEKLLYLEVEQLRYSLYLHDNSLLFQFLSVFYFAFKDITSFFRRKTVNSVPEEKIRSIQRLQKKKDYFLFLQKTPYAWIIKALRFRFNKKTHTVIKDKKDSQVKSYIIFGSTSSDDFQSRSVQIARKLAEKHNIIYIEGIFDEGGRAGYRIVEDSEHFIAVRLTSYKSFHLNYQQPSKKEVAFIKQSLKLARPLTRSPVNPLPYVHHPFWETILTFKKKSFILDRQCDFAQHHTAIQYIIDSEKRLMKNALTVTASNAKLMRSKRDIVIKNGVDFEMFKDTSQMIQTCDVGLCWIKKPVMGYIGTLDERIDEVLLGSIATAFPTASIVLVGNTDYRPVIEIAEKYQNIFPVGKQPYKKLPLFLQSFDILITPFKLNKNTRTEHPEFPLYLASGKPALQTSDLPAGRQGFACGQKNIYKQFVYYPKTHSDWMIAIAEALKEKKRSKKKLLRIAAAKKLIWKVKFQ